MLVEVTHYDYIGIFCKINN